MSDSTTNATFGFLYVLTNAAMPGHLKIGRTQRRPQERMAELSSATGVPVPFELAYSRAFANAALAEKLVHQTLEDRGVRVSASREFFEIDVTSAVEAVDSVGRDLDDGTVSGHLLGQLTEQSQAHLESGTAQGTEKALSCLEFAAQLGGLEQAYHAGLLALELADSRRDPEGARAQAYRDRARDLFAQCAAQGLARGHAQLALAELRQARPAQALAHLERYLADMPQPQLPQGELDFLLESLARDWMPAGEAAAPGQRLRPWRWQLLKAARAARAQNSPEFADWLARQALSTLEHRLEAHKLTLLALVGAALIYIANPRAFVLLMLAGAFFMWRSRSKRKARQKEQARRQPGKRRGR